MRSHPAWGEWIEIPRGVYDDTVKLSHPAWGEWIEIVVWRLIVTHPWVSPRMG